MTEIMDTFVGVPGTLHTPFQALFFMYVWEPKTLNIRQKEDDGSNTQLTSTPQESKDGSGAKSPLQITVSAHTPGARAFQVENVKLPREPHSGGGAHSSRNETGKKTPKTPKTPKDKSPKDSKATTSTATTMSVTTPVGKNWSPQNIKAAARAGSGGMIVEPPTPAPRHGPPPAPVIRPVDPLTPATVAAPRHASTDGDAGHTTKQSEPATPLIVTTRHGPEPPTPAPSRFSAVDSKIVKEEPATPNPVRYSQYVKGESAIRDISKRGGEPMTPILGLPTNIVVFHEEPNTPPTGALATARTHHSCTFL